MALNDLLHAMTVLWLPFVVFGSWPWHCKKMLSPAVITNWHCFTCLLILCYILRFKSRCDTSCRSSSLRCRSLLSSNNLSLRFKRSVLYYCILPKTINKAIGKHIHCVIVILILKWWFHNSIHQRWRSWIYFFVI